MTVTLIKPTDLSSLLTNLRPGVKLELEKLSNGDVTVSYDTPPKTKAELIEEKYPHLKGQGITISQAAKEYKVSRNTIEGWVYVTKTVSFVDEEHYPKLVDEAEVAVSCDIYNKRKAAGGLTGFPFFDEEGYLVEGPKHPDRSAKRRKKQA